MTTPLVTIKALQERMAEGVPPGTCSESAVRRMWWAALDTLQSEILLPMNLTRGLWLSSPLPALYEPKLLKKFQGWVWAPKDLLSLTNPSMGMMLPPSQSISMDFQNESVVGGLDLKTKMRNSKKHSTVGIELGPHLARRFHNGIEIFFKGIL